MILFEIDPNGVFTVPFEGQAPGTVDMDCMACGLAVETMEVEAGDIHFLRLCGRVQAGEPDGQSRDEILPDPRRVGVVPELGRGKTPE